MRFSASDIANHVGGQLVGPDQVIQSVSIDSRSIDGAALFVPIVAERDGHDFVGSALGNGAICFLNATDQTLHHFLDQASASGQRDFDPESVSMIQVDDTQAALTRLGVAARALLPEPVIGITGSVGKTSVKDLVAAACAAARPTHANPASFNNELGLPLTLVNAPDATEITILEMGARGDGHIAELCATGRPTIGVVTRVADAHTELFGSLAGVAKAKGELIEALPADGVAVLNADDPLVAAMASRAACPVVTFGATKGDFRATDIVLDPVLRPTFTLRTPNGDRSVTLAVAGEHMAVNAAGALAAAVAAGVDLDQAISGLETATISRMRMDVSTRNDGLVLIDDAFNANPTSMRAALQALLAVSASRRVAALGVMAELGPSGDDDHRAIAAEAIAAGVEVIAVDASAYGDRVRHVNSVDEAKSLLGDLGSDAVILIKGSKVAGLGPLGSWIREQPNT